MAQCTNQASYDVGVANTGVAYEEFQGTECEPALMEVDRVTAEDQDESVIESEEDESENWSESEDVDQDLEFEESYRDIDGEVGCFAFSAYVSNNLLQIIEQITSDHTQTMNTDEPVRSDLSDEEEGCSSQPTKLHQCPHCSYFATKHQVLKHHIHSHSFSSRTYVRSVTDQQVSTWLSPNQRITPMPTLLILM